MLAPGHAAEKVREFAAASLLAHPRLHVLSIDERFRVQQEY